MQPRSAPSLVSVMNVAPFCLSHGASGMEAAPKSFDSMAPRAMRRSVLPASPSETSLPGSCSANDA